MLNKTRRIILGVSGTDYIHIYGGIYGAVNLTTIQSQVANNESSETVVVSMTETLVRWDKLCSRDGLLEKLRLFALGYPFS